MLKKKKRCGTIKTQTSVRLSGWEKKKILVKNNWQLYLMVFPSILFLFVFNYMPMYGIQIAFRDYKAVEGIVGSEWVGLQHFKTFLNAYYFKRLIENTVLLNVYGLLWSFPIPIIMALLLNRIRSNRRKRVIQTIIYLPNFISTVVIAGMLYCFLSPTNGIINLLIQALGFETIDFMSRAEWFRTIYIAKNIWAGAGYGSILYIACLAGIDPTLYEAADIDGASIWQKIRHIDIPSIAPMVTMSLIMSMGGMLGSDATDVLIMQTGGNITVSENIGTYVYNVGMGNAMFSYTAAIGLFTNIINFGLIVCANKFSKKVTGTSMF